jgi:metal-responsive CopG/Arc/MetJ family transcriptional regulator
METIEIVLDRKLLQSTDRAARRTKQDRSAVVREALRKHLQKPDIRKLEELERKGYERKPAGDEHLEWEAEAVWPAE